MADVIAFLIGLESKSSLKLSDSFVADRYEFANELINSGYYVVKTQYGYSIRLHRAMWTRRVR